MQFIKSKNYIIHFRLYGISARESFAGKIHFADVVCTQLVLENLKRLLIAN